MNSIKMTDGKYRIYLLAKKGEDGVYPKFKLNGNSLYSKGFYERMTMNNWDNLPLLPSHMGKDLPLDPKYHKLFN